MATSRTTYKYHYKLGNGIVHTGITKDLDRREAEHRRHEGGSAATSHRSASAPPRRRRESGSKISAVRANQPARNDNSTPAPPNPTCRMPSSARPAILRRGRRRTPVGQPCAP